MTSKPHSALADALKAMALDGKFLRAASRAATCHCRWGSDAGGVGPGGGVRDVAWDSWRRTRVDAALSPVCCSQPLVGLDHLVAAL